VLPAWGVGIVYWPALHALAASHPDIAVLEVEPQGYWRPDPGSPHGYRIDRKALEVITGLGKPVLMHSVLSPLADAAGLDDDQIALLRETASILRPCWASEHLSFNRYRRNGRWVHAGFLLPPAPSSAAIAVAGANLQALSQALDLPVAGETGVNYLPARPTDLADGAFLSGVAEASDGGLLLDLHNLWCDEINGRARMEATLARLPLERVWEVHMAGGWTLDGVLLDAHGEVAPRALEDRLADLLPRLPNVRAVIFEVLPNHLDRVGRDGVAGQIERLGAIWRAAKGDAAPLAAPPMPTRTAPRPTARQIEACARHQDGLVARIAGASPDDPAGLQVFATLIRDLRASFVAQQLRHTVVLLMLTLGERGVRSLLDDHAARTPAAPTAEAEALGFADFLVAQPIDAPFLQDIIAIERAGIAAKTSGVRREIIVDANAAELFAALGAPRLPDSRACGRSVVALEPV
jgi:uncharacterized protein